MIPFPSSSIMKFSIICFAITLVVGLLSMGLLGQGLYYLISPILNLKFPPMKSWHGDWIWPVVIYVSLLWPFSFLIGGGSYLLLIKFGWGKIVLNSLYICILLIWDLFLSMTTKFSWISPLGMHLHRPQALQSTPAAPEAL